MDANQYVEASQRFRKGGILRNLGEFTSSHPLLPKRIDALLLEADTSSQDYEAAIRQISSQRNRLEAAEQVAATATLDNAFDQLKYDVHDGMRDYSEQMVTQIANKIKTARSDELERTPLPRRPVPSSTSLTLQPFSRRTTKRTSPSTMRTGSEEPVLRHQPLRFAE